MNLLCIQYPECFDSILVRLKVSVVHFFIQLYAGFDSILVRLKVHNRRHSHRLRSRFDSILVRLKGVLSTYFKGVIYQFRFHTGSIKRQPQADTNTTSISFDSILVRLKAHSNPNLRIADKAVSIPYWFD